MKILSLNEMQNVHGGITNLQCSAFLAIWFIYGILNISIFLGIAMLIYGVQFLESRCEGF